MILCPNLAPQMEPKLMFVGSPEATYLKIDQNRKICTTLKRKPCFCSPGAPQNRPKIDTKRLPRGFYLKTLFGRPKNSFPEPPGGPLDIFCKKKLKFWTPSWDPKGGQRTDVWAAYVEDPPQTAPSPTGPPRGPPKPPKFDQKVIQNGQKFQPRKD